MIGAEPAPLDASAPSAIPLESLPLAALVVDGEGTVTAVNAAWAALSRLDRAGSLGQGWLESIEPFDRLLVRDRVCAAAAGRQSGSAEYRLTGPEGQRWTRWWWQPTPTGALVVCVADIDDERAREASLWQRATHDPLTGLVNRAHFVDLVDRALQRRDRTGLSPAVVYVDLDGFKTINDSSGHQIGDGVLRAAAERMAAGIRPADVIARVGGDEFAVLCDALHHPDEGDAVARRIHLALSRSVTVNGDATSVTATTGVAVANPDDSAEALLARADQAMYAARRRRRLEPIAIVGRDEPAATTASAPRAVRSRPRHVRPSAGSDDGALRGAMDALLDAERLLTHRWNLVAGDTRIEPDVKDRLVQAARLARAAARTLHPDAVA